jgi:non-heme chloroperoxidase
MTTTATTPLLTTTRRDLLLAGAATLAASLLPTMTLAADPIGQTNTETSDMSFLKTTDGTQIYYKDWGPRDGKPVVFHHGWPLSADDWDGRMLFFVGKGYRVIAHDRRGHGRSTQTATGNDMDTYASDIMELARHLDLKDAIHVGHSTGGGEVARYVARAEKGRVSKAVLISAITPLMLKTSGNPSGIPIGAFDGFRHAISANRAQFFLDIPSGPFFGYNRPGTQPSEGVIRNWWRQAMMGGAKAQYDCVKALSETDFTADLKTIDQPVLVMHGEDDQIVPFALAAPNTVKLLRNGTLKAYPGLSHGMCTTHGEVINEDLLLFFQS